MMDVVLTYVGRRWLQGHYPQGIVWDYDVDKPFKPQGWAAARADGSTWIKINLDEGVI